MFQKPLYIHTPTFHHAETSTRLGKQIYFKMECFQPSGSFKARGIGTLCKAAVDSGKQRLISSSGGNAGLAAAYAGRQLGVSVTVVVPESTNAIARQRIAAEGAEVIVHGAMWSDADAYARQLVAETDAAYIHPFDNPITWQGHSTMIDEAVEQCPKPDVVIVCVGGGGLMVGVIEGMQRHGWNDVPVLAVETKGADSLAQAVAAGHLVRLERITSIATTLGAAQVTARALELAQQHPVIPVVVSDRDAVRACLKFADDLRVVVEPSCGATLSFLYDNVRYLEPYQSALFIVCGGAGATIDQLQTWEKTL